jgi:Bardet-Biedl syndrome 4 protein
MQEKDSHDEALMKYRVASSLNQNSSKLWNNIGMCFFGRQKYIAAIACLKKAFYLDPFDWTIAYNLGLIHLHTEQFMTSCMYFNSSKSLNNNFAFTYANLAVALGNLGDTKAAYAMYDKAISINT